MVQFLEQRGFLFDAEGGGGGQLGEEVGELAELAAEGVIFGVVERVCEVVAAADGVFAVRGVAVGFVGYQVDFAKEFRFVVFEFADHCCGRELGAEGGGEGFRARAKS